MPKPHDNESRSDFISRCVPEVMAEGKTQEEALALCYIYWEEKE